MQQLFRPNEPEPQILKNLRKFNSQISIYSFDSKGIHHRFDGQRLKF
jgi:hypothetical protein